MGNQEGGTAVATPSSGGFPDISSMMSGISGALRENPTVQEMSTDMSDPNFMAKVKKMFKTRMETLRPWNEFANVSYFSKPESVGQAMGRASFNVRYFATNYFMIFIGLFVYSLVTSPFLLLAVAFVLAGSAGILHLSDKPPLVIGGKEWNTRSQKIALGCIAVPLFWLGSAGSVVFWLLGCSGVVILAHASFLNNDMIANSEEWAREIDAVA
ncbi:hypothetical protein SARC_09821 [Sphaeroforma arctica JP610]|uniref:PRA1 family protein n=1 Tax=Sphaeroforma arctica JP610 TaxID=667725 RepID=A0A0L0FLU4_9EUKA|nr:hypothetical protein SARC_09821 [Sphaeroforma arctica JP610]KNC77725.1 hypothetical protein SARC_09821 [Sphaeroforma arctica JP610]|eukprot:XP_014151627.1 hypothetical protein SARC_09821 [Sphaeroforma arctica JP610]